jgi:hypothetical protein
MNKQVNFMEVSPQDCQYGIRLRRKAAFAIHHAPFGDEALSLGKVIDSPIGKLAVVFSHKHPIGRVLKSPYLSSAQKTLHHSTLVKLSTHYVGNLFVDDHISMIGLGSYLLLSLNPNYPLDGDSTRNDE